MAKLYAQGFHSEKFATDWFSLESEGRFLVVSTTEQRRNIETIRKNEFQRVFQELVILHEKTVVGLTKKMKRMGVQDNMKEAREAREKEKEKEKKKKEKKDKETREKEIRAEQQKIETQEEKDSRKLAAEVIDAQDKKDKSLWNWAETKVSDIFLASTSTGTQRNSFLRIIGDSVSLSATEAEAVAQSLEVKGDKLLAKVENHSSKSFLVEASLLIALQDASNCFSWAIGLRLKHESAAALEQKFSKKVEFSLGTVQKNSDPKTMRKELLLGFLNERGVTLPDSDQSKGALLQALEEYESLTIVTQYRAREGGFRRQPIAKDAWKTQRLLLDKFCATRELLNRGAFGKEMAEYKNKEEEEEECDAKAKQETQDVSAALIDGTMARLLEASGAVCDSTIPLQNRRAIWYFKSALARFARAEDAKSNASSLSRERGGTSHSASRSSDKERIYRRLVCVHLTSGDYKAATEFAEKQAEFAEDKEAVLADFDEEVEKLALTFLERGREAITQQETWKGGDIFPSAAKKKSVRYRFLLRPELLCKRALDINPDKDGSAAAMTHFLLAVASEKRWAKTWESEGTVEEALTSCTAIDPNVPSAWLRLISFHCSKLGELPEKYGRKKEEEGKKEEGKSEKEVAAEEEIKEAALAVCYAYLRAVQQGDIRMLHKAAASEKEWVEWKVKQLGGNWGGEADDDDSVSFASKLKGIAASAAGEIGEAAKWINQKVTGNGGGGGGGKERMTVEEWAEAAVAKQLPGLESVENWLSAMSSSGHFREVTVEVKGAGKGKGKGREKEKGGNVKTKKITHLKQMSEILKGCIIFVNEIKTRDDSIAVAKAENFTQLKFGLVGLDDLSAKGRREEKRKEEFRQKGEDEKVEERERIKRRNKLGNR